MTNDKNKLRNEAHDSTAETPGTYASPPCYQHELDPSYQVDANDNFVSADSWVSVAAWRKQQRARLVAARERLADAERDAMAAAVRDTLRKEIRFATREIGFYWPLAGEIDLRPLIVDLQCAGLRAALPVIVEKGAPLEFWQWHPQEALHVDGVWGIPAPVLRRPVSPSILLIPLLGFDCAGHRLGHGGGYYDRTLAAMNPRPFTVGIGYEFGRLGTIYPQRHDVPLDAIVTEQEINWHKAQHQLER